MPSARIFSTILVVLTAFAPWSSWAQISNGNTFTIDLDQTNGTLTVQ